MLKKIAAALAVTFQFMVLLYAEPVRAYFADVPANDYEHVVHAAYDNDVLSIYTKKSNEDTLSHIKFDLITGKTTIVKTETKPQLTCMNTVKTKDNLFYIYGQENKITVEDSKGQICYSYIAPDGYTPWKLYASPLKGAIHIMVIWLQQIPRDASFVRGKTVDTHKLVTHTIFNENDYAKTDTKSVYDTKIQKNCWSPEILFDTYDDSIYFFTDQIEDNSLCNQYIDGVWKENVIPWTKGIGEISFACDKDYIYYSSINGISAYNKKTKKWKVMSSAKPEVQSGLKIIASGSGIYNYEIRKIEDPVTRVFTGLSILVTQIQNSSITNYTHTIDDIQLWQSSFWIADAKHYMICKTNKGILILEM